MRDCASFWRSVAGQNINSQRNAVSQSPH